MPGMLPLPPDPSSALLCALGNDSEGCLRDLVLPVASFQLDLIKGRREFSFLMPPDPSSWHSSLLRLHSFSMGTAPL